MANSGIVIPTNIGDIINERTQLFNTIDEAQTKFNEVEKKASPFSSVIPASIPSDLSSEKTVIAEVLVAIQNVRNELVHIGKHQETIQGFQGEISKLKKQQTTIYVLAGIFIAIVLCVIVLGGVAIIGSMS